MKQEEGTSREMKNLFIRNVKSISLERWKIVERLTSEILLRCHGNGTDYSILYNAREEKSKIN